MMTEKVVSMQMAVVRALVGGVMVKVVACAGRRCQRFSPLARPPHPCPGPDPAGAAVGGSGWRKHIPVSRPPVCLYYH